MKLVLSAATAAILAIGTPALAGPNGDNVDNDPGINGRANALSAPGFARASEANGKGLGHAADLFGDNGRGNGADPDSLGLADDHDPGNVGGGPDTSR